jgi:hypothetical protein
VFQRGQVITDGERDHGQQQAAPGTGQPAHPPHGAQGALTIPIPGRGPFNC